MTCFAVCAAIRPKSCGVTSSRWTWSSGTIGPVDVEVLVVDERVRALAVLGLERFELGDRALAGLLDQPLLDVGGQLDRVDAEVALVVELDRRVARRARGLLVRGQERVLERVDQGLAVDPLLLLDDANRLDDLSGHLAPSSIRLPRTIESYGISTGSPLPRRRREARARRRRRAGRGTRFRSRGAHGDRAADGALEVRATPERGLGAGRRDVDRVLAQVVAEDVGDALAERVVDALRMVDEDRHPLRAGELERQDLDSGQAALDARGDLAVQRPFLVVEIRQFALLKKNGRGAPISNCLKCGETRIARRAQPRTVVMGRRWPVSRARRRLLVARDRPADETRVAETSARSQVACSPVSPLREAGVVSHECPAKAANRGSGCLIDAEAAAATLSLELQARTELPSGCPWLDEAERVESVDTQAATSSACPSAARRA